MEQQQNVPSTRSGRLQCNWEAWRVIAAGELALEMPAGNVCDMHGAIAVAEAICPGVWRIATFCGGVPDTEYQNLRGKWLAYDLRPNT